MGVSHFVTPFVKDNREAREITPRPLACPVGGSQTVFVHRGELTYTTAKEKPVRMALAGLWGYSVTCSPFGRIKELSYLQPGENGV